MEHVGLACLIVRRFALHSSSHARSRHGHAHHHRQGANTLHKDLLKHLGVNPGEKVVVEKLPNGRIEVKASRPTGKISAVFNLLKKKDGPSLSLEDINEVTARGWSRK